jgi:hypothetical protein
VCALKQLNKTYIIKVALDASREFPQFLYHVRVRLPVHCCLSVCLFYLTTATAQFSFYANKKKRDVTDNFPKLDLLPD